MHDDMIELDYSCRVRAEPGYSPIQHIDIAAICIGGGIEEMLADRGTEVRDEGIVSARLSAWRFTCQDFVPHLIDADLLDQMDRWRDAVDIGETMKRVSGRLKKLYDDDDLDPEVYSRGLIVGGILEVEPWARGQRLSHAMMSELKRMHVGIPFYFACKAYPLEADPNDRRAFATSRRALIDLYLSFGDIGLSRPSPRAAPGLLTAYWNDFDDPIERWRLDRSIVEARLASMAATGPVD